MGYIYREWTEATQAFARTKIGETTCVNLGQRMEGPLGYLLIDLGFPKDSPCLPEICKLSVVIE